MTEIYKCPNCGHPIKLKRLTSKVATEMGRRGGQTRVKKGPGLTPEAARALALKRWAKA